MWTRSIAHATFHWHLAGVAGLARRGAVRRVGCVNRNARVASLASPSRRTWAGLVRNPALPTASCLPRQVHHAAHRRRRSAPVKKQPMPARWYSPLRISSRCAALVSHASTTPSAGHDSVPHASTSPTCTLNGNPALFNPLHERAAIRPGVVEPVVLRQHLLRSYQPLAGAAAPPPAAATPPLAGACSQSSAPAPNTRCPATRRP